MNIDLDVMREIVADLYVAMVVQEHGAAGGDALRRLLTGLRVAYKHLIRESVKERVIVFKALADGKHPLPKSKAVAVLRPEALAQEAIGPVVIQILDNGEFLLWRETKVAIPKLASVAVVYEYSNRVETFFAKAETRRAPKVDPGYSSIFALPTFSDLREALDCYRTRLARLSTCEILTQAWFDSNRLFWKAKPEVLMRKSLTQFLLSTLRNAEVRPEQIVDETHPVDIKVTWLFSNRLALIEIKWLGKSRKSNGAMATGYTEVRARNGAKQLVGYLDANRVRAPDHVTRGYLAVFDARRRGLKKSTKKVDLASGMHFAGKNIDFNPRYDEERDDFEEPFRFFVEPKCA